MKRDKDLLRKQIFSITIADAAGQSARIMARVGQLPEFAAARVVAAYWPIEGEVDTRDLIERWAGSKRIVLPVVCGDSLIFREYTGSLASGAFAVREPCSGEVVDEKKIDLAIVPGAAFTIRGARLGRGKGFYDRFLAAARAYKVGVCFRERLVDEIPLEAHDVDMDAVISD